jgi:hypothetical protein
MSTAEFGASILEEDSLGRMGSVDNLTFSGSLKSPNKGNGGGSLFQLSCAHANSPNIKAMGGYSGRRFRADDSDNSIMSKVPSIGYTGSHKGKVHGKV